MKLRQARKIMKNIRLNPRMESLYGIGRAMRWIVFVLSIVAK